MGKEEKNPCQFCSVKDQQKILKELMKKRVKPKKCPYIKTCDQKVLEMEAKLLCQDKEITQEAIQIHMSGKHVWELCKKYLEIKREKEGKLPREW